MCLPAGECKKGPPPTLAPFIPKHSLPCSPWSSFSFCICLAVEEMCASLHVRTSHDHAMPCHTRPMAQSSCVRVAMRSTATYVTAASAGSDSSAFWTDNNREERNLGRQRSQHQMRQIKEKAVELTFAEGNMGVMEYLERIGRQERRHGREKLRSREHV